MGIDFVTFHNQACRPPDKIFKNYFSYFSTKTCVVGTHGSFEHPKHMLKLMGKEINSILGAQTILIWPMHNSTIFQVAIPHLRKTKGNIINIASMSGVLGQGNAISYVSSKVS